MREQFIGKIEAPKVGAATIDIILKRVLDQNEDLNSKKFRNCLMIVLGNIKEDIENRYK